MREREAVDYSFNCTFFVCDGLLFISCGVFGGVAGPPFHGPCGVWHRHQPQPWNGSEAQTGQTHASKTRNFPFDTAGQNSSRSIHPSELSVLPLRQAIPSPGPAWNSLSAKTIIPGTLSTLRFPSPTLSRHWTTPIPSTVPRPWPSTSTPGPGRSFFLSLICRRSVGSLIAASIEQILSQLQTSSHC